MNSDKGEDFLYDNDFDNEFDRSVFLRIGQSLCDDICYCIDHDDFLFNKKESLCEEKKIFEMQKSEILNQIEYLTISNKKLSDKIKSNEDKLRIIDAKFSILGFMNKNKIKKTIDDDGKLYNETFDKITNMYEEIVTIDESIKNLK